MRDANVCITRERSATRNTTSSVTRREDVIVLLISKMVSMRRAKRNE